MMAPDSAKRTELSILVQSYGDCTQSKLGVLSEMETRSLLEVVFFGERTFRDVVAGASGDVTSLETEAVHNLFNVLSGSTVFRDILLEIMSGRPMNIATVSEIISNRLGVNDPAIVYVDSFALVVIYTLRTVFDSILFPALESSKNPHDSAHATASVESTNPPSGRRPANVQLSEALLQLGLSDVLSTYCDFRDAKAPSLSPQDKEYLRLQYLWGKDMRSISRVTGVTYQRVQQVEARANARLLADLQQQESFARFWEQLQKLCVVSPGTLIPMVQSALGDTSGTSDANAIAQFLMSRLKSKHRLAEYVVGRKNIWYARGTLRQLTEIIDYVRELALYHGDNSIGAAAMFVMSHSELPSVCVPNMVSELLSALPSPTMGDRIERVIKSNGTPSHYSDVARSLEEKGLVTNIEARQVLTVLGRDPRFTWAGLGTYALCEWGYPRASSTLDVVLHMIQVKGGGVTLNEIREFLFVEHKYCIKESSVRAALKLAEDRQLVRIGNEVWDAPQHRKRVNKETEHE